MQWSARQIAITGAASGIGRATAEMAARQGAHVIALDRDIDALNAMQDAFMQQGWPLTLVTADLGNPDRVKTALARDMQGIEHLDLLVNSAGIVSRGLVETTSLDEWKRVFDINLSGALLCMQEMLPRLMKGRGKAVVNVASLAAKRVSYTGGVAYTAAKAGMLGLTRHAAFEWSSYGIRVNAVCPGPVWTALTQRHVSEAEHDKVAALVPLQRWLSPDDVAQAILFLGSDAATMITGTTLDVDGGLSLVTGAPVAAYRAAREGVRSGS